MGHYASEISPTWGLSHEEVQSYHREQFRSQLEREAAQDALALEQLPALLRELWAAELGPFVWYQLFEELRDRRPDFYRRPAIGNALWAMEREGLVKRTHEGWVPTDALLASS